MARTPSTQRLPLGRPVPDFTLPDPSGKNHRLQDLAKGKPTVVVFACNHCPYVIHVRDAFGRVAKEFQPKGVAFVAINSNDAVQYPDDAPSLMPAFAQSGGWNFPYLVDESQEVARAWHAACTPDLFVLDTAGKLAYAGQFDSSRPGNGEPVDGRDLRAALEALLSGKAVPSPQKPSLGCNIKWKPGNEPA
ncbi:thioredoxin family protein [bacterium]|nr:thioredoxin family protein [bacterium]NDA25233.1 thioredoxin family protein [Verrucomicrobiota bacterium]